MKRLYCDGLGRRDLLRVGVASGLGIGLTMEGLFRGQALAAEGPVGSTANSRDGVSVIILFLKGGLSTIDTLDLKPNAPSEIRGEFDRSRPRFRGCRFANIFPSWRSRHIGFRSCDRLLIQTRIMVQPIIGC